MPQSQATEHRLDKWIALIATIAIAVHILLRATSLGPTVRGSVSIQDWPLLIALLIGGIPLVIGLLRKCLNLEFGSDLLAGISIVTAILLGEYLAGTIVVLMLSGGEALEVFAINRASSVLDALAKRRPTTAHKKEGENVVDVPVGDVRPGDPLVVFSHEICPVDGTVLEGNGSMDESFLTGEPYLMPKTVGSSVFSGTTNGESLLLVRADKLAVDSRYAQVMKVTEEAEKNRPPMRRLGETLGAIYTPIAVILALIGWWWSGDVVRFLAVLVVATPCPLLIAIPVAIIGSISLAARRGIIIRDPAVLERITTCHTAIFDKTGTLTYGKPAVTEIVCDDRISQDHALSLVSSIERYSRHPLGIAIVAAADERSVAKNPVMEVSEIPGQGLRGIVAGRQVRVTSRNKLKKEGEADATNSLASMLPPQAEGLECVAIIDEAIPVLFRLRDRPRADGASFVKHLKPEHQFTKVMIVSGDRESEVRHLAEIVGIHEVHYEQSPEDKLQLVRRETKEQNTVFVGDGINDAPALTAATVGIAFGESIDITSEAAHAVVLETSIGKVDELLHIGRQLRKIVLQCALGGMGLSICGMILAAYGLLSPVSGAITQEVIDLLAILNALRAAGAAGPLTDYDRGHPMSGAV